MPKAAKKVAKPVKRTRRKPSPALRLASAVERLADLYALHLRTLGITTDTGKLRGEVLETDEELLADMERKEFLKRELGLPDHYEIGAAIPRWDAATGRELPPLQQAEGQEGEEASASGVASSLFSSYSAAWGPGPEGSEGPQE